MKLFVLFGQRKQSYPGEYGPEVLLCWDEFCVDENPDGWDAACASAREDKDDDFSAMRVVVVSVDGSKIARLLNETPEVTGEVEEA